MENIDLYALATRICDTLDTYDMNDAGATVDDIADALIHDPNAIIKHLLTVIEERS